MIKPLVISLITLMAIIIGIKLIFKNKKISKNKLFIILGIAAIIIIILSITVFYMNKHKYDNVKIEDNYFAVLSGGGGEIVNRTYLYMDNGNFKYIQTQSITTHWGSSEWVENVTSSGKLDTPKEVIEISKQNNSNGWVQINVDIEENLNGKIFKKGDLISFDELIELISVKQKK